MNFKSYPEYKDSGVPWLGDVPKHWELWKTKYLFKERVQKGFPNEPLLAATQTKGVVPKTQYETRTVTAQKDFHLLKLVKKGDFVISLRSFQGGIEFAYYQGIISPAYTIMIPNKEIYGGYFQHLAKSKVFVKLLTTCVTGIREGQNIDYEILKRKQIPIPSLTEQTHIARFLDYKTAQIGRFIKAKKRMIELLKEQKQVIINDAVTGKIDVATGKPYPKYKDSGVEWLGQIPCDWNMKTIKRICHNINEQTNTKLADENYIALENVEGWSGKIILPKEEVKFESQVKRFRENDILFGKLRPYLAKVVRPLFKGVCVGEFLVLRKTTHEINERFLEYKLRSKEIISTINQSTFGAKMPRADWGFIGNLKFSFPVQEEQQQIISYIEIQTAALDLAISRTEREITLMQEYRTRLISDVVTGKIDVRDITIPDIIESVDEDDEDEEKNSEEVEESESIDE